eukprot:8142551-Alexandrium_andersonii.AAC.1
MSREELAQTIAQLTRAVSNVRKQRESWRRAWRGEVRKGAAFKEQLNQQLAVIDRATYIKPGTKRKRQAPKRFFLTTPGIYRLGLRRNM